MATITGTNFDDVLPTTDPDVDSVSALGGNDVILIASAAAHGVGETINGGTGFDRIWFTSTTIGETLLLQSGVTAIEAVDVSDEVGNTTGTTSLNIDASAVATGLQLSGNDGTNILTGTRANDIISGGGGQDTIVAGLGADRVIMRSEAGDLDSANAGAITENNTLVLVGTAAGTMALDLSSGTDQLVSVNGVAEGLVQTGFTHVDATELQGAGVSITGTAQVNTLIGSAQDDVLEGGAGLDVLIGGEGNDVFLVSKAADMGSSEGLNGGLGTDILRFTAMTIAPVQTLTLGAGVIGIEEAEIADATGDTSGVFVLNLSAAAVLQGMVLRGNDGNNVITGTKFDDILNGNGGADTLNGGLGNDFYVIDSQADSVLGDKIADSGGTADYVLFSSTNAGETLTLGTTVTGIEGVYLSDQTLDLTGTTDLNINAAAVTTGLSLFGNAGANTLTGTAKNDSITGGLGADTIAGGKGNDTVSMSVEAADVDTADAGDATSSENNTLILTGAAAGEILITLGVLANADQLISINGVAEGLIQSDFRNVDASAVTGAPVNMTGSSLTNVLTGTAMADVLAGAGGSDTLSAGGGNDVILIASAADFTTSEVIDAGGDIDTLRFTFTSPTVRQTLVLTNKVTGLEAVEISDALGDTTGTSNLSVSAATLATALTMTGNDGDNKITGTAFNDVLNGNGGDDELVGGLGDDRYVVDAAADFTGADKITDVSGTDTLAFVSTTDGETLTLSSGTKGIELFVIESTANINLNALALTYGATITGGEGDNILTGTKFADTLYGGLGDDQMFGGLGNDTVTFDWADGPPDAADAGTASATEINTLVLKGPASGIVYIDLSLGPDQDQVDAFGESAIQSDFTNVDASLMTGAGVDIIGSARADRLIGTAQSDVFTPGLGKDIVEGGLSPDLWLINTQAEYDGDFYTDSGSDANDYIVFTSSVNGATLVIRNNVAGVDAAATSYFSSDTTNLNINASAVDHPFGLQGNAGNNILTGTRHGESFFDEGGIDVVSGGGGDDDYVIFIWTPGDRIIDSSGFDDVYFADPTDATIVIDDISGIERFVISGGDLVTGLYRRDNTTTNNANLDASAISYSIHLAGNYGDNILTGTRGADEIIGWSGQDTIIAGQGADKVTMEVEDASIDAINAGALSEGNQWILTGVASDILTIDLSSTVDQLVSVGAAPEALIQVGFRDLDAGLVTGGGLNVTGSSVKNVIIGSSVADVFIGTLGGDQVSGGGGNDRFVFTSAAQASGRYDAGAGDDSMFFASTTAGQLLTLSAATALNFEVIAIGDATGDTTGTTALNIGAGSYGNGLTLIGNDGANTITGTAFDDIFSGNGGADILNGGGGNDLFLYEDGLDAPLGEKIIDSKGTTDTVRFFSAVDGDTLVLRLGTSGIDIVETSDAGGGLGGTTVLGIDASLVTTKLIMRGNDGANALTGTAGADTITGNGGLDTIIAGAGADTIHMSVADASLDDVNAGLVTEGNWLILSETASGQMIWDLTSAGDQLFSIGGVDEGRTITGVTHLDAEMAGGGIFVTLSTLANQVMGTSQDDFFIVLSTAHLAGDKLNGKAGNDVIRFASGTAGQTLTLGTTVLEMEQAEISDLGGNTTGTTALNLSAAAVKNAMTLIGNDGVNILTGTAFADTITGNGGADTINAGAGLDKVYMDVTAGSIDTVNAGAITEGNQLVLTGAPAGAMVIDLAAADQIVSVNGVAEALKQSGFLDLDGSALNADLSVNGSTGANRILGGGGADTLTGGAGNDILIGGNGEDAINGGLGADRITMAIDAGHRDTIDAGAVAEGNLLLLTGTAPGTVNVDLSALADQLVSVDGVGDALLQTGFLHLDASGMGGGGVDVTGSAGANTIIGTAGSDVIDAGAGADRVTMNVSGAYDTIDAGGGSEGDYLVLTGGPAGVLGIDLSAAPGSDQLLTVGAGAEALVQSDFQHLDLRGVTGQGANVRGNDLDNIVYGTLQADTLTGLGGADYLDLGALSGESDDGASDLVIYEGPADGWNGVAAQFSYDQIIHFKSGSDGIQFTTAFNGGADNLDDIDDNDAFEFVADMRANFHDADEALFLSAAVSKLKGTLPLNGSGFSAVASAINKVGVDALAGDDGLIVVQTTTSTGIYYYQESDGKANNVAGSELALLGIIDVQAVSGDFVLG